MRAVKLSLLFILFTLFVGGSFLSAQSLKMIVVINTDDSGLGSLRAAVDSANACDSSRIIFDFIEPGKR